MNNLSTVSHKRTNGRDQSIRYQMIKTSTNRGMIIATFWWNNTVTTIDGFGNTREYPQTSELSQQQWGEKLISDYGYTRVEVR